MNLRKMTIFKIFFTVLAIFLQAGSETTWRVCVEASAVAAVNSTKLLRDFSASVDKQRFETHRMQKVLEFLAGLTTGRQFNIVYDETTQDVEGIQTMFHRMSVDTTLFNFIALLQELRPVLKALNLVDHTRYFFVFSSAKNTLELFSKIRQEALESHSVKWFVVANEPLTSKLQLLLREGTQVVLLESRSLTDYAMYSSRIALDGNVMFLPVGEWQLEEEDVASYVREELLPSPETLYSDFKGRRLMVAVVDNWPFFKLKDHLDGSVSPDYGIDVSIFSAMAKTLNFTFGALASIDGQWGNPQPDGTISGIIGMVARHEADVAIDEITITKRRATVVDFTNPYFMESGAYLSLAPREKSRVLAVFSPFVLSIWIVLIITVLLMGLVAFTMLRLREWALGPSSPLLGRRNVPSLASFVLNTFNPIVMQQNRIVSYSWSTGLLFAFWYFFCLVVDALYSGTLTAVLAVPAFEKPLDSLNDLLQAALSQRVYVGYLEGASTYWLFENANYGIYKDIREAGVRHEKSLVQSTDDGMQKVMEENYVYVGATISTLIRIKRIGMKRFHMSRESFFPQGYAIACPRGSPYRETFNKLLIWMVEAGLVVKWTQNELDKTVEQSSPEEGEPEGSSRVFSLAHLQAAFFLLFLGLAVSFIVLLLEVVAWKMLRQWKAEEE